MHYLDLSKAFTGARGVSREGSSLPDINVCAKLESVGLSDGLNVMNDGNEEVMKILRSVG